MYLICIIHALYMLYPSSMYTQGDFMIECTTDFAFYV